MAEEKKFRSARNICFTLNNYTEAEENALLALQIDWKVVKYLVFGYEVGKNGTPHLQGYIEFSCSVDFKTIKNKIPRAHIEARRGTSEQAADYCKKDGKWIEFGERNKQGKRSDIHEAVDSVVENLSTINVDGVTFVKYHKGLTILAERLQQHRKEPPHVSWFWGKAGTGKTREAVRVSEDSFYIKDGTQWWDNYQHEDTIIIDDFDGRWPYRDLLRLLDRYPYQGQIKGAYCKINSPNIIITCEHPPEHFWSGNELAQITRRLTVIKEMV